MDARNPHIIQANHARSEHLGGNGRLFGAVTSKEISDALSEQFGISIPKAKIVQDEPIKAFGGYELKVKLGYEVTGTLKVVVAEA